MVPLLYLSGAGSRLMITLQKINLYLFQSASLGLILPSFDLYPTMLKSTRFSLNVNIFVSHDWQYNTCSALWVSLHMQAWCRMLKDTLLPHTSLTAWEHFTNRCEFLLCLQVMVEIAPIFWPGQYSPPYPFSSTVPSENMLLFQSLLIRSSEHSLQVLSTQIPRRWFSCSSTR